MANHISELRINAGIKTAKEAASILEISSGMMYQMELGVKKPSALLAIKMTHLFNCTLEDIFLPYFVTNSDNNVIYSEESGDPQKFRSI